LQEKKPNLFRGNYFRNSGVAKMQQSNKNVKTAEVCRKKNKNNS
jgi:hypothetical protein